MNRTNLATVEDSPHDSTSLDANGKRRAFSKSEYFLYLLSYWIGSNFFSILKEQLIAVYFYLQIDVGIKVLCNNKNIASYTKRRRFE